MIITINRNIINNQNNYMFLFCDEMDVEIVSPIKKSYKLIN